MRGRRYSAESGLEFVGDRIETDDPGQFRPAAHIGPSELDLRRMHRRSTRKKPSRPPSIRSSATIIPQGKNDLPQTRETRALSNMQPTLSTMFPIWSRRSVKNMRYDDLLTPTNSAELLRAEEIEMELLNRQREKEFNIARKLIERRKPPHKADDRIEFIPEQIQELDDYECRNSARNPDDIIFGDYADVSRDPSYTHFELPYHMKCLNRYKDKKHKYEMQLRHELEMLQEMQPSAYEAARFAIFLGPKALQKTNYSPRTVKFTPKEKKRIQYLLLEEQR